ncbi:META domain-containing protein [Sphingosinicella sp.]|uniref:META domain-containing protein n=1 Tax=Sphingosinicella sp. TaxID=1917971 RepID=UPI0040377406
MIPTAFLALVIQASQVEPAPPYRASGASPAWSLTIADGRISFSEPGRPTVSVAAGVPRNVDGIVDYNRPPLNVTIMADPCDVPDGRYADAVFVTIAGRDFRGCGGNRLPADSLAGTSWHFAEIAGETVPLTGDLLRDDVYAIDFSADSFAGYGGCNRIGGQYVRSNEVLTVVPPIMSTRRACAEPIMRREQRLIEILSAPVE